MVRELTLCAHMSALVCTRVHVPEVACMLGAARDPHA
jgi:hypothetical protein